MTLDQFIQNTKGKRVDVPWKSDGRLKGQCVSLIQSYLANVLGQPAKPRGNAVDWTKTYVREGLGTIVNNIQKGDIIVFPNEARPYGHIAIAIDNNTIYDQNNLRHDGGCAGYGVMFSRNIVILRPNTNISYQAHVQDIGWQKWVSNGQTAGTTGQSKRLEAIRISSPVRTEAAAHIQNIGWQSYGVINSSTIIGTIGKSLRMEALILNMPGYIMRGHIQGTGWTNWINCDCKNVLGTTGKSLRLEAIEIKKA